MDLKLTRIVTTSQIPGVIKRLALAASPHTSQAHFPDNSVDIGNVLCRHFELYSYLSKSNMILAAISQSRTPMRRLSCVLEILVFIN